MACLGVGFIAVMVLGLGIGLVLDDDPIIAAGLAALVLVGVLGIYGRIRESIVRDRSPSGWD